MRLSRKEVDSRLKSIGLKLTGNYHGRNYECKVVCLKRGHISKVKGLGDKFLHGYKCKFCLLESNQQQNRLTERTVALRLADLKYSIVGEYTGKAKDPHLIRCELGHRWKQSLARIFEGNGCPRCAEITRSDANKIRPKKIAAKLRKTGVFIIGGKYLGLNRKHRLQCQKGHEWTDTLTKYWRKESRCPICVPTLIDENRIRRLIESLTQKKFPKANPSEVPWLHGLHLDGYCRQLKSKKFPNGTAFEYQGPQHYQLSPVVPNDTREKLLRRKQNDWRKKVQCWRHGVRLISIPYSTKNIRSYLEKRL